MNKNLFERLPVYAVKSEIIRSISKKYDFVYSGDIGTSVCGRKIEFLRLGNRDSAVLWAGAFHGMEWLTSLVLLKFANELCENINQKNNVFGINADKCLQKRGLVIVPCVNPDGAEIAFTGTCGNENYDKKIKAMRADTSKWQANARGVDLNHNYGAGWDELHIAEQKSGITGPGATRFGGDFSASEPETRAMMNLCKNNSFCHAIAFHSQGEEIYWQYGTNTPRISEDIARTFAISSGYTVSSPQGLAVGGGFKDWFIQEFCRPGFTVEIGKGINPLPLEDLQSVYKKVKKILYISALVC